MLGHMVVKYLRSEKVSVLTSNARWPELQHDIKSFKGDYIVNCIGAIPQRTNDFNINWQLPIWLDLNAPSKVIHPGTDCEIDEDPYGVSKNIAGNYIRTLSKQTRSIKTSILGPEITGNASLMSWFLSQQEQVYGYTEAIWNGNTTLEWSKQCLLMMKNWNNNKYKKENIIFTDSISKYDLLSTINEIFNKDIKIIKKKMGKNKSLNGTIYTGNITSQLNEMKEFYYE